MDTRKESILNNQLQDSQQNKRLNEYRSSLARDCYGQVFDDKLLKVLLEYVKPNKRKELDSVRGYLDNLRDSKGLPFSRSQKEYSKMLETLQRFKDPDVPDGRWRKTFRKAVERVTNRYSQARLNPLKYRTNDDIYELIKGLHTSTGYTKLLTGVKHKCDLPHDQLLTTWQTRSSEAVENGTFDSFILWYWRSQASGEFSEEGEMSYEFKRKTRPVWAVDVWTVISEMMFSKPLNNWLKFYPYSAIGKDDNTIWQKTSYRRGRYIYWYSLDYSKFDASIPAWLIYTAFEVLASAFNLDPFTSSLLKVICHDFIHKSVILNEGVVTVDHGNPSGSGLTAIINGICNELMTETWMVKYDVYGMYMIMGDDNLIFLNKKLDLSTLKSYLMYNFGVEIHDEHDKGGSGRCDQKDPEFLSRFWTHNGPYRHPNILVSKMLYPERFRTYDRDIELTPEIVFYSYILGYRAGMEQMFDIERFLVESGYKDRRIRSDSVAFKQLPYNVQLAWAA